MISLKQGLSSLGILIIGILGGVIIVPRKHHYPLNSPQNLARLARGREIRRNQQRAMSAQKREMKIARLQERIERLK